MNIRILYWLLVAHRRCIQGAGWIIIWCFRYWFYHWIMCVICLALRWELSPWIMLIWLFGACVVGIKKKHAWCIFKGPVNWCPIVRHTCRYDTKAVIMYAPRLQLPFGDISPLSCDHARKVSPFEYWNWKHIQLPVLWA